MRQNFKRPVSAVLAAIMLMSAVSTTAIAFAEDGANMSSSTSVVENVTPESSSAVPEEGIDSSSVPEEDLVYPDSTSNGEGEASASTSESTPEQSSSESTSQPDSTAPSEPESGESDSSEPSSVPPEESVDGELPPVEAEEPATPEFVWLELIAQNSDFDCDIGDEVEFFVRMSRDDVNVRYQWQSLSVKPETKPTITEPIYNYAEGESHDYYWPVEDMTPAQVLAWNPNASWPGCEIYFDMAAKQMEKQVQTFALNEESSTQWPEIDIPNGTHNYVLDGEEDSGAEVSLFSADGAGFESVSGDMWAEENWKDIEGATEATYRHVASVEDAYTYYRCKVIVEDEAYIASAQAALVPPEQEMAPDMPEADAEVTGSEEFTQPEGEETSEPTAEPISAGEEQADGATEEIVTEFCSEPTIVMIPTQDIEYPTDMVANTLSLLAASTSQAPNVYLNNNADQPMWVYMDSSVEYLTADTYNTCADQASQANDVHWTKVTENKNGEAATGANGRYVAPVIQYDDQGRTRLAIPSAWYGKRVYFRYRGQSGTGTAIDIPAYSSIDYQTGNSVLYKNSINVLSLFTSDATDSEGNSFYGNYVAVTTDSAGERPTNRVMGGVGENYVRVRQVPIAYFNKTPDGYLKDAEGNYKFDIVTIGPNCYSEPDISGAAAWALQDYLTEGYGMMIGHDTIYGYGGIGSNPNYVPDRNETVNMRDQAHYNLNWLVGSNKGNYITPNGVSPYEARSLILNITDRTDKSYMYGDDSGVSRLVVKTAVNADVLNNVAQRTPTNYPYNAYSDGSAIAAGSGFNGTPTHTNQQLAFGTVWIEYASNTLGQSMKGDSNAKATTWTYEGLTGTNNFYLTTNGNIGMNQIGHKTTNLNDQMNAKMDEGRILINSLMYLAQRKQCQVCQSKQGGNQTVHFVHGIESVEQLNMLADQDRYWYTYPMDGCYLLTQDITLPDDWTPIKGFYGHFDADGHTVTLGKNGAPLFEQKGSLGEYNDKSSPRAWNLGTDKTKGLNNVSTITSGSEIRTTGIARVVGYLNAIVDIDVPSYNGWTLTIHGSDGKDYNGVVNSDGKYTVSNLPCTGEMKAVLKDASGKVIYGEDILRVCVPGSESDYDNYHLQSEKHATAAQGFWASNETTSLYLLVPTIVPVKDREVYETQEAKMLNGAIVNVNAVENVYWEFRPKGSNAWASIDSFVAGRYKVETASDKMSTRLTLTDCDTDWSGYNFRAVFVVNGQKYDTYEASTNGSHGLLTVKPYPLKTTDPASQTVWLDGKATFTSTCEAQAGVDNGLKVQWQVRRWEAEEWMNVESYARLNEAPTSISISNSQSTDISNKELYKYKTTTTLNIDYSSVALDSLQFRVVYSYTNTHGHLRTGATNARDTTTLTVKKPVAEAIWTEDQESGVGMTFDNALKASLSGGVASQPAVYTAKLYYKPNSDQIGTPGTPDTSVYWKARNVVGGPFKVATSWTQATANAYADAIGAPHPTVEFSQSAPKLVTSGTYNGYYEITATMKLSNVSWIMYSEQSFLQFTCGVENHYKTAPYQQFGAETREMPLYIDFDVDINWNQGVKTKSGDHFVYTYPEMTVLSPVGVKTLLLYFDKTKQANFDNRDKFDITGLPGDMHVAISNPHYLMLVSDNAVSQEAVQAWLRNNVKVHCYNVGTNEPALMAYINAEQNLGGSGATGYNVNFYAGENGSLSGTVSYTNVGYGNTVAIPTPVADKYYRFDHWENKRGQTVSLTGDIIVTDSDYYTAIFMMDGDNNGNGIPDTCETYVTFEIENGGITVVGQEGLQSVTTVYPLRDNSGNFDENGTFAFNSKMFPQFAPNAYYKAGEWQGDGYDSQTGTATITKAGATIKMVCLPENDINKNGVADEEEPKVNLVFTIAAADEAKGQISGQSKWTVPAGTTWEQAGVDIPTVTGNTVQNPDGTETTYAFSGWTPNIEYNAQNIISGNDGDSITYTAVFEAEGVKAAYSAGNTNEAILKRVMMAATAPVSEDNTLMSAANVPQTYAVSGSTSVKWNKMSLSEGESIVCAATNPSFGYYQWQVSDNGGSTWMDCPYENNPTLFIGRVYGNMAGWMYRLKYGNSETDYAVSNTQTISFHFEMTLPGTSTASRGQENGRWTEWGNTIHVPSDVASKVTYVSFKYKVEVEPSTSGYGNWDVDCSYIYSLNGSYDEEYFGGTSTRGTISRNVNGLSTLQFAVHQNATAYNMGMWGQMYSVYIEGNGKGSGNGVPIQRNNHEAWDLTWLDCEDDGKLNATITASDKVYDGNETNAKVALSVQYGSFTDSDLANIIARGTIQYSNGIKVSASKGSGSECMDAGSYTATFIPSDADKQFFDGANASTPFEIFKRRVDLFSVNNDKVYDGNSKITVDNVQMALFNATDNTGVIPKDTGKVAVTPTTFDGTFENDAYHQTNGNQIYISKPANVLMTLLGTKAGNYYVGAEKYTGAINPRGLAVHSLYLDPGDDAQNQQNPRNVKYYDATTVAHIKDILIDNIVAGDNVWVDTDDYLGIYAQKEAGEPLNADGTLMENSRYHLRETAITRTQPISLVNNEYGDYYIASEQYSGGILRQRMESKVKLVTYTYGDKFTETIGTPKTYTSDEIGMGYTLILDKLFGDDTLTIDKTKSYFVSTREFDEKTPAGTYALKYVGLNEQNYPILSNYYIMHEDGTVQVLPRPLRITVNGGYTKEYGDPNPQFGVVFSHKVTDTDDTWEPGFVAGDTEAALEGILRYTTICNETSHPGRYSVSASGLTCRTNEEGNINYLVEYMPGDITVSPKDLTVDLHDYTKRYGSNDPAFTVLAHDKNGRVFDLSDIRGRVVRETGEDVSSAGYQLLLKDYDDDRYILHYDVNGHCSCGANDCLMKGKPGRLFITPALLTISMGNYVRYYGDLNPKFISQYNGFQFSDAPETALNGTLKIQTSGEKFSNVGEYTISVSGETVRDNAFGEKNYVIVHNSGKLIVKQRPLVIEAEGKSKVWGESDPALTWHYGQYNGVVAAQAEGEPNPIVVNLVRAPGEDLGNYPIYSDAEELENGRLIDSAIALQRQNTNYLVMYRPAYLSIIKDKDNTLLVQLGNVEKYYGEDNAAFDGQYAATYFVNGEDVKDVESLGLSGDIQYVVDCEKTSDVGSSYTVKAGAGSTLESTKYEFVQFVPGMATVKPRPVTLTAIDNEKTYGDSEPALEYEIYDKLTDVTYAGDDAAARVKPNDLPGHVERTAGEDVGKYPIQQGTIADKNYDITFVDGVFEITPAPLTVTVDGGYTKVYGNENPTFGVSYDGFVGGDDESIVKGSVLYETDATKTSNVGKYPVSIQHSSLYTENENGADNYEIIYVDGDLTIKPKEIVVKIDGKTQVYGDPEQELTYTTSVPVVDPDNSPLDVVLERVPGTDVNEYPITGTATNKDGNYIVIIIPNIYQITPAKITVKANDAQREYGDPNPEFTATSTGFKYEDTLESLGIEYRLDCDVPQNADVGVYTDTIVVSGPDKTKDGNYNITYLPGTLEILPKEIYVYGIDIGAEKAWADGNDLHTQDSVLVTLLADGAQVATAQLDASNGWSHTFKGYALRNSVTGKNIRYDVVELSYTVGGETYNAGEGPYQSHVTETGVEQSKDDPSVWTDGFVIVNTQGDVPDVPVNKDLTIVKSADKAELKVGETVHYTLVVTNTGDVELANVRVQDTTNAAGAINALDGQGYTYADGVFVITRLPVGKTIDIQYSYTALEADAGKTIENVAVATLPGANPIDPETGKPVDPEKPADPDREIPSNEVDVPVVPGTPDKPEKKELAVEKSADKRFVEVGETVVYSVRVTNTGDVDLQNVKLADHMSHASGSITPVEGEGYTFAGGIFTIAALPVGETVTIHYTYTALEADAGKTIENVVVATIPGTNPIDPDTGKPVDPEKPEDPDKEVPSNKVEVDVVTPEIPDNPPQGDIIARALPNTKVYGNEDPELHYVLNIQPLKPTDVTGQVERIQGEDVGEYDILQGSLASTNYKLTFYPSIFSITPATLMVIANDKVKTYGDENPELTATITGFVSGKTVNGHKFGDTLENATGNDLQLTTPATQTSDVGTYPIVPSGLTIKANSQQNANYTVVYVNGVLTIKKAPIIITPDPDDPDPDIPTPAPSKGLTVVKRADKERLMVGETVTYQVEVTNTGTVELTNVPVVDHNDGAGAISAANGQGYTFAGGIFTIARLPAGKTIVITYTYTAVEADAGKIVTNVAIATVPGTPGNPDDPDREVPSNPVPVPVDPGTPTPPPPAGKSYTLVKSADKAFAKPGDTVNYTITVENTGKSPITRIFVSDEHENASGDIKVAANDRYTYKDGVFTIPDLQVGETVVIAYTYAVKAGDAGKNLHNVAVGTTPKDPDDPNPPIDPPPSEVVVPVDPDIAIIADPVVKVYGTEDPELTFTTNKPLVKPDDIWGELVRVTGEDVGAYLINRGTIDSKNYDITFIPGIFQIIPTPVVVTAEDKTRVYGEANPVWTATYDGIINGITINGHLFTDTVEDFDGDVLYEVKEADGVTDVSRTTDVGQYPIGIQNSTLSNPNYTVTYVDGMLDITKRPIDVTPGDPEKRDLTIVKSADKETAVVGDVIHYTLTVTNTGNTELENIPVIDHTNGAGAITAQDGQGYTYADGVFTVARLPVGKAIDIHYFYTVLAADDGKTVVNTAIATIPGTNPIDPDTGEPVDPEKPVDPDREIPSNEVEVPVIPGTPDTPVKEHLTVHKAADKKFIDVGETVAYQVTVKNDGETDLQNLTVRDSNDGAASITAENSEGYTYKGDGVFAIPLLRAGESIVITYRYTAVSADAGKIVQNVAVATIPGTNPIDPDTGKPIDPEKPEDPDKEVPSEEVEVEVVGPITVIAEDVHKIYGEDDPALTYKLGEEPVKPDDIHGELARVQGEEVGEYDILQGTLTSKNYEIHYIPAIFHIHPAPLVITAGDYTRYVDEPNPDFVTDPGVTYEGFRFDDGPEDLDGTLAVTSTGKEGCVPGAYPITPSGLSGKNYEITYVDGTLHVWARTDVNTEKTADRTTAKVGDVIYYSITVTNTGNKDLENVKVTDKLTAAGQITAEDGDGYTYEGNGVFRIASLKKFESVTITYSYVVQEADAGKTIVNSAITQVGEEKPEPPTPEIEIPVEDGSISIVKTADKTQAYAGDIINYTVTVTNTGSVPYHNVAVKDVTDGQGTIQAEDGDGYLYIGNRTFMIAELPVGAVVTIRYQYIVAQADVGKTVTNVAIASVPTPDPDNPEKEYPSDPVPVPVVPKPEPTPTPTPVPTPAPVPVEPPKTGVSFFAGAPAIFIVAIVIFSTATVSVVLWRRKNEDENG